MRRRRFWRLSINLVQHVVFLFFTFVVGRYYNHHNRCADKQQTDGNCQDHHDHQSGVVAVGIYWRVAVFFGDVLVNVIVGGFLGDFQQLGDQIILRIKAVQFAKIIFGF